MAASSKKHFKIPELHEYDDKVAIELYALAVAPLVGGCSASAHTYIMDNLIHAMLDDFGKFEKIVEVLQGIYPCLQLSCADIGAYMTDLDAQCVDISVSSPLAGYTPETNIIEVSERNSTSMYPIENALIEISPHAHFNCI